MNIRLLNTLFGIIGVSGWGALLADVATDVDLPAWARVLALIAVLGLAVWQALPDVDPKDGIPDVAAGFWKWLYRKLPWKKITILSLAVLLVPESGCGGANTNALDEPFAAVDPPSAQLDARGHLEVDHGDLIDATGQLRLDASATGYIWVVRLRATLFAVVSGEGLSAGIEFVAHIAKLAEVGGAFACLRPWGENEVACRWCLLWQGDEVVCTGPTGTRPAPPPDKLPPSKLT